MLVQQLECGVHYLGQLSDTFGISDLWAQYEPKIQDLMENDAECSAMEESESIWYAKIAKCAPFL